MKHKRAKEGKSPSNPRLLTTGYLMSIQKEGWDGGKMVKGWILST